MYMALEGVETIQGPGSVKPANSRIFISLGIIGIVAIIITRLIYAGFYLEFLRLTNNGSIDWQEYAAISMILTSISQIQLLFQILIAIGFFGVILSSDGKYGLLYIFVSVLPHSFNLYSILITVYGSAFDPTLAYFLNMLIIFTTTIIAILILMTTRYNITRPVLLYTVLLLMIAQPIASVFTENLNYDYLH
jgi:hypothetical protein